MEDPKSVKDVQRLIICIVALGHFIPQSSKQASKLSKFEWNIDYQHSFAELKSFLTNPPILTRPQQGEPLRIYLSASDKTVAAVLVRIANDKETPVYYISHALHDAKTRCPQVEKLVYALVTTSQKLLNYFQGRGIHVLTYQPLK